jgi:hypothetical protein
LPDIHRRGNIGLLQQDRPFLINAVSGIIDGEVAGPVANGTHGKRTLC